MFVAYLVLFAWLVTKIRFFTTTGLSNSQLIILFLLKLMAGIFYGWIGTYYGGLAQMYDTWSYHGESIAEYHLLQSDPQEYITNLFRNTYGGRYEEGVNKAKAVADMVNILINAGKPLPDLAAKVDDDYNF